MLIGYNYISFSSVVDLALDIRLMYEYMHGRNYTEFSNDTIDNCTKEAMQSFSLFLSFLFIFVIEIYHIDLTCKIERLLSGIKLDSQCEG